ncbi:ABC transporter permease [Streptomyces hydrogenans]|uniref:ABC transporter permease n=1 Tax=Streptomyces hydrogenans TaxID=1873719 RepID=A0ABQ3PMM2_9ACTN|nr:ABC transporter permease [Streptomyces hydrogenans]GHG03335.1 ABC transporter permease [Streptomyces hydrogenans]GHI26263.1 ABC transporter permease [Streptomyces hydrogenans]
MNLDLTSRTGGGTATVTGGPAKAPPSSAPPAPAPPTDAPAPDTAAAAGLVPATQRRLGRGKSIPFGRLLGPLLIVLAWWGASAAGLLDPRKLSSPASVVTSAQELWVSGRLQESVQASLSRALLGLLIGVAAGLVLALASGLSRVGDAVVDGTLQVKRSIPNLALLPLLILWLGIGETMKVVVIALGVTVGIYINTHAALVSIDARYVELAEAQRLSRWQFLRKVVLPAALPGFFTGLRLAVTAAWLGLIVVEQINATSGIGYMMFQAQQYAQSGIILVGLVLYGAFGFASDALVRLVEGRVLSWRRTITA